jgi:hypothetical protein
MSLAPIRVMNEIPGLISSNSTTVLVKPGTPVVYISVDDKFLEAVQSRFGLLANVAAVSDGLQTGNPGTRVPYGATGGGSQTAAGSPVDALRRLVAMPVAKPFLNLGEYLLTKRLQDLIHVDSITPQTAAPDLSKPTPAAPLERLYDVDSYTETVDKALASLQATAVLVVSQSVGDGGADPSQPGWDPASAVYTPPSPAASKIHTTVVLSISGAQLIAMAGTSGPRVAAMAF